MLCTAHAKHNTQTYLTLPTAANQNRELEICRPEQYSVRSPNGQQRTNRYSGLPREYVHTSTQSTLPRRAHPCSNLQSFKLLLTLAHASALSHLCGGSLRVRLSRKSADDLSGRPHTIRRRSRQLACQLQGKVRTYHEIHPAPRQRTPRDTV